MRIGRKVIFERGDFDHGKRVVSYGVDHELTLPEFLHDALYSLARVQVYAENDAGGRPCSLELVATVQHGWPIPLRYTLHFEVTPL